LILFKIIDAVIGVRVSDEDELTGLDLSQHSEVGYDLSGLGSGSGGFVGSTAFITHPSSAASPLAEDRT
jgi:hypothetical protein